MIEASIDKRVKTVILILFFLSGMCGILFGAATIRIFHYSIANVIAIFMAGLGLGSFISGRFLDDRIDLLKIYGVLEGALGCYCLLLPSLIRSASGHFNFFTCALILLIPGTLIGASWPVLIRFFIGRLNNVGQSIGHYYGVNVLGSFLGVLATGFFFLPYLGLNKTVYVAGLINVFIGSAALFLYKGYSMKVARTSESGTDEDRRLCHIKWAVLIGYCLSSLATMIYQLSWLRVLIVTLNSSLWAFYLIISVLLLGVALGSISLSIFIDGRDDPMLFLAVIEILIGVYCFVIIPLLDWFSTFVGKFGSSFHLPQVIEFLVLLFIISMPALLTGLTFPLVSKIYTGTIRKAARSIASVYAINAIGCLIGVLVWRVLLNTGIGIIKTSLLAICAHLMIGGLLMLFSYSFSPKYRSALFASIVLFSSILFLPSIMNNLIQSNLLEKGEKLLFTKEGVMAHVCVKELEEKLIMQVNGERVFSQTIIAHIPMLLQKNPQQILLLGFGDGIALSSIEQYEVNRINCVEMSKEVIEASSYFHTINNNALNDTRVEMINENIRAHLTLTGSMYDVIISQPTCAWPAISPEFLSMEFFQLCKKRLTPEGIIAVRLSAQDIQEENFKSVLYTYHKVFPFINLWEIELNNDYLLLGSNQKIEWDEGIISRRIKKTSGLHESPCNLLSHFFMDAKAIVAFCSDSRVFTDDDSLTKSLYDEHKKEKNLLMKIHTLRGCGLDDFITGDPDNHLKKEIHRYIEAKKYIAEAFLNLEEGGPKDSALDDLKKALNLNPDDEEAMELYVDTLFAVAEDYITHKQYDPAILSYQEIIKVRPENQEAHYQLAELYYMSGFMDHSIIEYEKVVKSNPDNEEAHCHLGRAYLNKGWLDRALVQFELSLKLNPKYPEPYFFYGTVYLKKGLLDQATEKYKQTISLESGYADAHYNLGLVYLRQGLIDEAISEWEEVVKLKPDDVNSRYNLAVAYYNYGKIKHAITHLEEVLKLKPDMYQATSLLHMVYKMRDE
ncbi:MAG: fused MFS/spermidine synthase [bacterium]